MLRIQEIQAQIVQERKKSKMEKKKTVTYPRIIVGHKSKPIVTENWHFKKQHAFFNLF